MNNEHPFAHYVRILAKGKTSSRSLTQDEAYHAFRMILQQQADDLQIGAFLMLLRVKEETVDEMVGFVRACKDCLPPVNLPFTVDLDWSSYAGKRKHYPWYLLAALTLARHGYRVAMHGFAGHTANRVYSEQALQALDYPICQQFDDVEQHLKHQNFAYIPLSLLSTKLAEMMQYRSLLGVRSPVHSICRLINPLNAKAGLYAIFHPAYRALHQQTILQLGYPYGAVIKGEGGEFERNPDAKTLICGIKNGERFELELPKLNADRSAIEEQLDLDVFKRVWLGQTQHSYGIQAVTETMAIALLTMQTVENYPQAQQLAQQLWHSRWD